MLWLDVARTQLCVMLCMMLRTISYDVAPGIAYDAARDALQLVLIFNVLC